MDTKMNPIKELERQLEDTNKALTEALAQDAKEVAKLEIAILALANKIEPLSKKLRDIRAKSEPYCIKISAIQSKIDKALLSMIGPWVIENREARLYYYHRKKEWYNRVAWFRGVSKENYNRVWTVQINGLPEYELAGPHTQETMLKHLKSIEKECEKLGYIVIEE